jgi:hypothetical protein
MVLRYIKTFYFFEMDTENMIAQMVPGYLRKNIDKRSGENGHMIWYLLVVVILAALMGFFQVPIWIVYCILFILLMAKILQNPLLFGRDPDKIMTFLKKSK